MSHTTTLTSVPIKSLLALRAAATELAQLRGFRCTFAENAVPRMYYPEQHGACELVLRFPDAPYDIGVQLDKETGQYNLVYDVFGDYIGRLVGADSSLHPRATTVANSTETTPLTHAEWSVSALLQGYCKFEATRIAACQGYTVTGCFVDERYNVNLSVERYG